MMVKNVKLYATPYTVMLYSIYNVMFSDFSPFTHFRHSRQSPFLSMAKKSDPLHLGFRLGLHAEP